MSSRPSPPPAVSAELLQAILGAGNQPAQPPPTIHINVQQGGSLTLVLGSQAPSSPAP